MELEKISATKWLLEVVVDAGGRNQYRDVDIEAKLNGLDIDGKIIPWAEIDAARASLSSAVTYEAPTPIPQMSDERKAQLDQQWGAGITQTPIYLADQERRNQEARDAMGLKRDIKASEESIKRIESIFSPKLTKIW